MAAPTLFRLTAAPTLIPPASAAASSAVPVEKKAQVALLGGAIELVPGAGVPMFVTITSSGARMAVALTLTSGATTEQSTALPEDAPLDWSYANLLLRAPAVEEPSDSSLSTGPFGV
jgi:hypothetical protein